MIDIYINIIPTHVQKKVITLQRVLSFLIYPIMVKTGNTTKKVAPRAKSQPSKLARRKTMSEPLFYKNVIVAIPGREAGQNFKLVRV